MFGRGYFLEDPVFAGTHQLMHHMDQMMNSMMHDPFQSLMQPMHHHHTGMMQQSPSQHHMHQTRSAMIPFGGLPGFPMPDPFGMGSIFQGFGQGGGFSMAGSGPMFSSSSVMTMTTDNNGQPQVYQASTTTRNGPGGIREVHRSVSDSRSGVRKMAIGRHIGERGHVQEKEQNYHTGDTEEREDFINMEEEEAQQFDDEWKTRAQPHMHGRARIEMPRTQYHSSSSAGPALAITAGPSHNHHYQDADRSARRHSNHSQGLGPDRNARKRSGKSRHETSM